MSHEDETNEKLRNTIFLGEIATVHNYGAFVKIPGGCSQGLIHRTQISKAPVDDAADVLQRGERVWCKVIGITDDNKVSLSMKVVDQGSGKDLDPNGIQIQQDELRRKNYDPQARKKVIELEAVFNTTCSKCGTHGHLAKDCFKSPDGKTYELLPDEDEAQPDLTAQVQTQPADIINELETKLKKHKKEKKKKKKHKKERSKKSHKHKKLKKSRKGSSESPNSEESSDEGCEDEREKRQHKGSSPVTVSSRKRRHSQSPSKHHEKIKP